MSDTTTPDAPLWQWSACDLAAAIFAGKVTSADAVASVVERMRATNGALNAQVVDQKGRATPNGVTAFKDIIAPDDAPLVKNFLKHGNFDGE